MIFCMSILQQGSDGKYTVTVPKSFVVAKSWQKGDDIGFAIVDEINRPQPGDIFIRRNAAKR
jgi:hypothetical protein